MGDLPALGLAAKEHLTTMTRLAILRFPSKVLQTKPCFDILLSLSFVNLTVFVPCTLAFTHEPEVKCICLGNVP